VRQPDTARSSAEPSVHACGLRTSGARAGACRAHAATDGGNQRLGIRCGRFLVVNVDVAVDDDVAAVS